MLIYCLPNPPEISTKHNCVRFVVPNTMRWMWAAPRLGQAALHYTRTVGSTRSPRFVLTLLPSPPFGCSLLLLLPLLRCCFDRDRSDERTTVALASDSASDSDADEVLVERSPCSTAAIGCAFRPP